MLVEVILLLVTLFLVWYVRDRAKHHRFPPGPFRFPILGNLPQLAFKSRIPSTAMRQLSDQYGDVMYLKMGFEKFVVFSSHSALMELFSLDSVSSRRKIFKFIDERNKYDNVGLFTSNGPTWECLRRFTIRTLRDFGFGKSSFMNTAMSEEAGKFVDYLKSRVDNSPNSVISVHHDLFNATVVSVLWRLLTGHPCELNDERMTKMLMLSDAFTRSIRVEDISVCYPFLRDWFPNWTGRNHQAECVKNLNKFIEEVIKEHEARDYVGDPQCYIDVFLSRIDKDRHDPNSYFTHNQLVYSIQDLFLGGAETTSQTLAFSLVYMILNPEVQEKVQQEIDSVWEGHSIITSDIKMKLPYTSAVILELTRIKNVVPFPFPYESPVDLVFRGYKIPKGTTLMTNYEAVHFQSSIWGDPDNFRPERFINSNTGQIDSELAEFVIPFGKGKRVCIGQSLAETTIFIYFTTLMKYFKVEKVQGDPGPSTEPMIALVYTPMPFNMKVTQRC